MSWLVPRNALTLDQLKVVELPSLRHCIVMGSPGSGKTLTMLHRARHLLDTTRHHSARCLILVYTNVLKEYLRSSIQDLGLASNTVQTLDGWCMSYYIRHMGYATMKRDDGTPDFPWVRQRVSEHIETSADVVSYDYVLADEGQDIDEFGYRILRAIGKHLTVFVDRKQQIYEWGSEPERIRELAGSELRRVNLGGAYRCSPYVVSVAAAFIHDAEQSEAFIQQNPPVHRGPRQVPLMYLARDHDDEIRHLIDAIRTRVDKNERIGILLPSRQHATNVAEELHNAGLMIELRVELIRKAGIHMLNFASVLPKALAYPSAKGLTFDSVFMPLLEAGHFSSHVSDALLEKWLFVGISRATQWVYFSATEGYICHFDRFESLAADGKLSIHRGSDNVPPSTVSGEDPDDGGNLSDLF